MRHIAWAAPYMVMPVAICVIHSVMMTWQGQDEPRPSIALACLAGYIAAKQKTWGRLFGVASAMGLLGFTLPFSFDTVDQFGWAAVLARSVIGGIAVGMIGYLLIPKAEEPMPPESTRE